MISGFSLHMIVKQVQARIPCHPATIKTDIARVHRRWAREDARGLEVERRRAVRRLRRVAGKAEASGDYGASTRAEDVAARIGGTVAPQPQITVHQTNIGVSAIAGLVASFAGITGQHVGQQQLPEPTPAEKLEPVEEVKRVEAKIIRNHVADPDEANDVPGTLFD